MNFRKKSVLLFTILLLLILCSVFADTINGYSDAVLTLLPRSLTYNRGDAIELTHEKSLVVSDLGSTPLVFNSKINNDPAKNLGIIRIQDTLYNTFQSLVTWNGYTKNDYRYVRIGYSYVDTDEMFKTDNSVVLRIHTTGIFVKEDNPNIVRDFSLSCFVTEANITQTGSEYTKITGFPKVLSGDNLTLSDGVAKTYFKNLGGGDYELYIPSTPLIAASTETRYYPLLLRVFDLCVNLSGEATTLEPGYYKTEITIQSVSSFVDLAFTGERRQNDNGGYSIIVSPSTRNISETITVWGYVGAVPSQESAEFNFSVSPSIDTYSMNLGELDYYNVATVNFYNVNGPYQSDTEPEEATQKQKYIIYISPGPDYLQSGTYVFTKSNGTGTIPYDLYLDSSGATFVTNVTVGMGGSGTGGTANGSTIPSSSYYILPNYSIVKESFYGQQTRYTETWNLSSVPIYLKVTPDNVQHTSGEYKSNLYFTVVVQ